MTKKVYCITLEPEIIEKVDVISDKANRSRSGTIEFALKNYIEFEERNVFEMLKKLQVELDSLKNDLAGKIIKELESKL